MKTRLLVASALSALILATPVMAEPVRAPAINAHQHHQHARMAQGARSGQLTRDEATSLAQSQQSFRQQKRAYRNDNGLNADERKDLHQSQQELSRSIYNEKHDSDAQAHISQ